MPILEHFVTLFNSTYLPQGLALHRSMERHIPDYTLWVLCVDEQCFRALSSLRLTNVQLLNLIDLETEDLKKVKEHRSLVEYCWTLTPFAPRFVFESDSKIPRVTYIDADIWFRANPKRIFSEFENSGKEVLITDHAYAPEYDQSATSGKYCVQFLTFNRTGGEVIRKTWEDQCIEWCFNRYENGRFGDQKYLDDWPDKFESIVHILEDKELILAPWNIIRFPYGNSVIYHFHGLKIKSSKRIALGNYRLPMSTFNNVYKPYSIDLKEAINTIEQIGIEVQSQAKGTVFGVIIHFFKHLLRPLKYHLTISNFKI